MAISGLNQVPERASVVVVGAGISGLVAARDLVRAGIDVLVVEADDEIGGRIKPFVRNNAPALERGAEFTGPDQPAVLALVAEYGFETEPYFVTDDLPEDAKMVRLARGKLISEAYPFESSPEVGEAFGTVFAQLGELASDIDPAAPWEHPRALEFDRQTVGAWLDETIADEAVREVVAGALLAFGPAYEVSLLSALAYLESHGGAEHFGEGIDSRLSGPGTSGLIAAIAAEVGDRIALSAPVRKIVHGDDGVSVHTDRGAVDADAVIVAMDPGLCAAIEFDPPVPADRDRLQTRWNSLPGAKIGVIYDEPFWREAGITGMAMGLDFMAFATDGSLVDGSQQLLNGMVFAIGPDVERISRILQDPELLRKTVLEDLASCYGPKALEPKEFHCFDWHGNRWARGAGGAALGPGVLTSCGVALRRPLGRVIWAGEAAGTGVYMQGAVTAGHAAAETAAELVSR
ncbi:MAG TPA: FAD-dependent oxidoreductase [Baekduia sp.]|nr:FAD-dependent oxidoreductase [Baekduia sp.]